MNGYFLLVLIVGPILAFGPPLLAIWLCERHSRQHGWAIAAKGELQVANAEAARRAAVRSLLAEELTR